MSVRSGRRPLPALAFLLILTILTGVVWWRVLHRPDATAKTATPVVVQPAKCSPGGKALKLPTPAAVRVTVLNGAGRDLLATQVSAQLKSRGFATGTPNDAAPFAGVAQIQFGTTGKPGATLLSYYLPGAQLLAQPRTDSAITVVLGARFKALATPAAVNKALASAKKPC